MWHWKREQPLFSCGQGKGATAVDRRRHAVKEKGHAVQGSYIWPRNSKEKERIYLATLRCRKKEGNLFGLPEEKEEGGES